VILLLIAIYKIAKFSL